jgi:hypothetical protein
MNLTHSDAIGLDELPSVDALMACTVALMTVWADPHSQAGMGPAQLRHLIARKVVSNLFFLQHHPLARPELRQSLAQAHARWVCLVQQADRAPAAAAAQPAAPASRGRVADAALRARPWRTRAAAAGRLGSRPRRAGPS